MRVISQDRWIAWLSGWFERLICSVNYAGGNLLSGFPPASHIQIQMASEIRRRHLADTRCLLPVSALAVGVLVCCSSPVSTVSCRCHPVFCDPLCNACVLPSTVLPLPSHRSSCRRCLVVAVDVAVVAAGALSRCRRCRCGVALPWLMWLLLPVVAVLLLLSIVIVPSSFCRHFVVVVDVAVVTDVVVVVLSLCGS
ncbi:hypothetical protein DSM100238_0225 [Bifidobacterium apri]|uniref:Uncharacterized protein n=1 Tax=Bifidobacterium apri TaxID=1769423 RepID=A0A6A2VBJ3_9BIFI|nr:hypothetical protein DSM100238_0225 [Bifidobacterium apri]